MPRRVYLDNNATTSLHPEVLDAMMPFLKEDFGNPSSLHRLGRKVRVKIDEAREKVAAVIGADPSEIVFTSGGSESDNFAIKGCVWANKKNGVGSTGSQCSGHIITSAIEHHAVLDTCKYLENNGYRVTCLPVDEYGLVNPLDVEKAISSDTILLTIHHSNNEIGTIEPIEEISKIARSKGVMVHTDAVQSLGKVPLNVNNLGVDLLSVSAHKLYGPKGVGALYIRKGIKKMHPLISGGHQEKMRRGGTENAAGIVGFGKACELALANMNEDAAHLSALRDRLQNLILEKIPHVKLNGHPEKRLPTTLNMSFKFAEGEALMINLDLAEVAISTGSACTSGTLEPSHVLSAMGIPHEIIHGSLRFSFGRENTVQDVDYVMEVLPDIVRRVREMEKR
ncbi:MAG: cysteine desulfurase NifS [Nitrospinae bacterium]|nr:cysteine desulfurase NifS [Nitrospinota bacterium]